MDRLRLFAVTAATTSALSDAVLMGGWLAARELDHRPALRRRSRALLCGAYAAQIVLVEAAWARVGHPPASLDARTAKQVLALAALATAVVSPLEHRAPRWLAARGATYPHLVLGAAVGLTSAACALPVWLADGARRRARVEAELEEPPDEVALTWRQHARGRVHAVRRARRRPGTPGTA